MRHALRETIRKSTIRSIKRATDQRTGIAGNDLVIPIPCIVQERLRVGDAVLRLHDRVVNLRNADVEDSVSGAHDQRAVVANGISQPGAWSEIVRLERNFSGGREQWI